MGRIIAEAIGADEDVVKVLEAAPRATTAAASPAGRHSATN